MRHLVLDQPQRVMEWVTEHGGNQSDDTPYTAIGLEAGGELIAGVVFNCYTGSDVNLNFAASRGTLWGRKRWLEPVFSYVFKQLRCTRCTVEVSEHNKASIAVIEDLGFTKEGVKRCAYADGADVWCYGLLRSECKFLRMH